MNNKKSTELSTVEQDFNPTDYQMVTPVQTAPVIINDEDNNFIADLTGKRMVSYSSIKASTMEEKKAFFNAVNSTQKRIGDCINEVINIKDVYVEVVKCTNDETGEVKMCPRVVLVDNEGTSFQSVSVGIFNGIKKIFEIFGTPDQWETTLPLKVKQITKGQNKILTLEFK